VGPETAPHPELDYWLDSSARIVKVSGEWNEWLDRDGEGDVRCRREDVIGQNLFSFIHSAGVQHVYQMLHERVLRTGDPVELVSRCDSPSVRRDLRIRICPDGDLLRYNSVVTRQERRNSRLPWPVVGSETLVAMCSLCKRFRFPLEAVEWREIELLFEESALARGFSVTHGMCAICSDIWYPGL
jgi:hypothetical protein